LGHGLAIAVGMAVAERSRAKKRADEGLIFVVLSDGECQEGSTWEAAMTAANLGVGNLVAVIDNNDFQSFGRTSETHPHLYPLAEKFLAFGWDAVGVNGHDGPALFQALSGRNGEKPLCVIAKTIKGRGVNFMENVPIWHYRSPTQNEYCDAIENLREVHS